MNVNTGRLLIRVLILLFSTLPAIYANDRYFPGSGTTGQLELIPSAYWPPMVTTQERIATQEKSIPKNSRGALIRIEKDILVVDFGRHGIQEISPKNTDFHSQLTDYIKGDKTKEFTNMSLQVGNKIMDFGRGSESGAIRFDEVKDTQVYIFIYLETYSPEMAQPLVDFEKQYQEIKSQFEHIEVVLMPHDREFYNFGYTVGYSVPFIATHMRIGYIKSLAHDPGPFPYIAITDANGRLLKQSEANLKELGSIVINQLSHIGLELESVKPKSKRRRTHSARWRSN